MVDDIIAKSSSVSLVGRENITISGVSKVTGFDANEFLLDSVEGPIYITGENLELLNLKNDEGIIQIHGKINSFSYINKKRKKESIIAKLFQ